MNKTGALLIKTTKSMKNKDLIHPLKRSVMITLNFLVN